MNIFIKGIIVGLYVAIPIGPSGLLCVQRSLLYGRESGIFVGLGAAAGDAFFSIIAALGLTFLYQFLQKERFLICVVGGLFLVLFGIKNIFTIKKINLDDKKHYSLFNSFILSVFLTLTNPLTILFFISIFPAMGICITNKFSLFLIASGTFTGTALWFTTLSFLINKLKSKFSDQYIKIINTSSGILIIFIGLFLLFKSI